MLHRPLARRRDRDVNLGARHQTNWSSLCRAFSLFVAHYSRDAKCATYNIIGRGVIVSFLQRKTEEAHPAVIFRVGVFFCRRSLAFLFFLFSRQELDCLSYPIAGPHRNTAFYQDITYHRFVRLRPAYHLTPPKKL